MTLNRIRALPLAAALLLLGTSSCRRSDMRVATIDVPEMEGERAVRIVTNSVANEVVGRMDRRQKEHKADLENGFFYYYEGPALKNVAYRESILGNIRDVGLEADVLHVWHCPPPPVKVENHPHPIQMWANRHALLLRIGDMKSAVDANRVVGAIARARTDGNTRGIVVDRVKRRLTVSFDSMRTDITNMEHGVACSGYGANSVPDRLGADDAIPWCWEATTARLTTRGR